jgi:hypothetical protein
MGDTTQAFDIFQTPLSSHYPLPLIGQQPFVMKGLPGVKRLGRLAAVPAHGVAPPPPPPASRAAYGWCPRSQPPAAAPVPSEI